MVKLPSDVLDFFQKQGFVIVITRDLGGSLHCSCKGIVRITPEGKIYLLDVYKEHTYENLKNDDNISIAAVDEHRFKGYCLKGNANIVAACDLDKEINAAWEERISGRITQRVLKNLREEKGHPRHPEASFPKPQYLIVMDVNQIVDLTPRHLK
ncbi:MAG: pyridoxamine 5'-phosphate oxidase family protein [Candidatus Omnitrophota bacterium]